MSQSILAVALAVGLHAPIFNAAAGKQDAAAVDPATSDATLHDIFFLDANRGWAVGEHGVIWNTIDGGRAWQLQRSGTVCGLRSVWFADEKTGWIAGGQSLPYSQASSGLVLGTSNGGETWQPLSWQQFPRLHRVQFVTARAGWAWGESSELFPSGLIASENAGRAWQPVTGPANLGWLAGHFKSADAGVIAGSGGNTSVVIDRSVQPVSAGSFGQRAIRSAKFSNDGTVWAVGDGALILRSNSFGTTWSVAGARLSDRDQDIFDWRGVHAIASSVWIVGRPGSVVLASSDSGANWQAMPTGQPLPLESVWFHDRKRGWAVGALGTILSTSDGGRTWQVQRRGGERAALLAVHAAADAAPFLSHVQLGAEQGYLAADLALVPARASADDAARATIEARLADAARLAGAARAECEWRFPASPAAMSLSQVLDEWNRQREGHAMLDLERRLALAIRMWRPEVIVADSPDPAMASDPAAALVAQAVERAFQRAADPAAFPELRDVAGLEPWSVKKLYVPVRGGDATVTIDGSELSRKEFTAGRPIDDQATLAGSLVWDSFRPTDSLVRYRLAATRLSVDAAGAGKSLMDQIVLEPGGPARRRLPNPVEFKQADLIAIQTRRNFQALVARADEQPLLARQLTGQADKWLKQLPPDQAGQLLFSLARTHVANGRWEDAREIMEKLVADYPNHLTSGEAHRWLIQFYASSEARHRERLGGMVTNSSLEPQRLAAPGDASKPERTGDARTGGSTAAPRVTASGTETAVGGTGSIVAWNKGAVEAAKRFMQLSPLAAGDPAIQFPLATAQRALGNLKDADRFYTTFGFGREFGPWCDAARSERWIRDRQGRPPKPVIVSFRAAQPPRLDGVLDDPVWKSSVPVALEQLQKTDEERWDSQVRVAHDRQFLYIAVACYSSSGGAGAPVRPRSRDMDLDAEDRVEFFLDLDRDYATYYHLAVDRRGCTRDACWGDRTWDPTWYVASQCDEHGYRIEAAVPLAELTGTPPADGTVWAFNAVRLVPGRHLQAWSRPAGSESRPEGMGLLFFSDGPANLPRPAVAN